MVTKKAAEPDLPLNPIEPRPICADEVVFEVEVRPWVVNGEIKWSWSVVYNSFVPYVGDWTSLRAANYLDSEDEAEEDARRMIANTRHVIDVKLGAPEPYRIKL